MDSSASRGVGGIGAQSYLITYFAPERFYKADKARSRCGAGLGLAIAKHIIESHGGTVRARNNIGRGATFTITLSAAHAAVVPEASPSFSVITQPRRHSRRVIGPHHAVRMHGACDVVNATGTTTPSSP